MYPRNTDAIASHLDPELIKFYIVQAIYRPYAYLADDAQYVGMYDGEPKTAAANPDMPFVEITPPSEEHGIKYHIDLRTFGYHSGYITWLFGNGNDATERKMDLTDTDLTPAQRNDIQDALAAVGPYF